METHRKGTEMNKLELKGVKKSFGHVNVIKDITFSVNEGEFVSILGPSGSGKSTLFQIIGGMIHPDEGEIILDGKNINGKRGSISYMPQTPSLFPWRTILENLLLGQEIAKVPLEREKAMTMLDRAGLKGYERAYPYELSGGMQQRVSFLRSILSPQTIICLDEPFSSLDEFTRQDMQKWLQSIWIENRRTILLVTHNIEEALFLSDRIFVFSDKPAIIVREFHIPFVRPRREELLLSEQFLDWKRKIYEVIKK